MFLLYPRELRGAVHEKLLTTQVEMVNRDEHLKKVAERQKLAEEQIKRLEAELSEAQQKKNEEVWTIIIVDFYTPSSGAQFCMYLITS